jgi:hypothetical protein
MVKPVTVYLDTQDYSRLDDARAGRSTGKDLDTLGALMALKEQGAVRFVYSAMVISELLQYEGGGKDLTRRKAETLTLLTDHRAFIHPSKLVAFQVAERLAARGFVDRGSFPMSPISDRDRWFPDIEDPFGDVGSLKQTMLAEQITGAARNRAQRRMLKARARDFQLSGRPESTYGEVVRKYPFSTELLTKVMPKLFDGRISKAAAEEKMLDEMGDPPRYVVWFFKLSQADRSSHDWMKSGGEAVARGIREFREKLSDLVGLPDAKRNLERIGKEYGVSIPLRLIERFTDDMAAFGIDQGARDAIAADENLLRGIPFASLWASLLPAYMLQHSGVQKSTRTVRESDGGDLLHTLTLPYVDLWRGDVYFSDLVRKHAPVGSAEVVSRLEDLPSAIERLLKAESNRSLESRLT